ncbi:MAG: tetratricopeptide repeat protein [Phycisphaeraceae bacterium]|nr:tetratricopeptide repeat protein [Phycisphaeraceae bacterium]
MQYRIPRLITLASLGLCLGISIPSLAASPSGERPIRPIANQVETEAAREAARLYAEGRDLFFKSEFEQAVETLAKAVEADADNIPARLLYGRALTLVGKPADAIEQFQGILSKNPEHVEAGTELASLLDPDKEPDRIISTLTPLLPIKTDYTIHTMLAQAWEAKLSAATTAEETAQALEEARRHRERAIELNPRDPRDHTALANLYLTQRQFARAAASLETAAQLTEPAAIDHFRLATVYFNLRNYLGRLTVVEAREGKIGDFTAENQLLIEEAPGRPGHFIAAPPRSAIHQIHRARALGLDAPELIFLEANTWLNARRFERAESIYAQMEDKLRQEDRGLYWYYRAQAARGMNNPERFIELTRKAIEVEPDIYQPTLGDALLEAARMHERAGDIDAYLHHLRQAVRVNPLSVSLHLTLADALWQLDRKAEAATAYRLALDLSPQHARRAELLNRIRMTPAAQP